MKYSVTVNGKNYELPARNEEMDKMCIRDREVYGTDQNEENHTPLRFFWTGRAG